MRVIIAGSRNITDYGLLLDILDKSGVYFSEIVSGGARGVDALGERFAIANEIPLVIFPANWDRYGRAAGPVRNTQMSDYADALVAIRKDYSRGTTDMIKKATARRLHTFVCDITNLGRVTWVANQEENDTT